LSKAPHHLFAVFAAAALLTTPGCGDSAGPSDAGTGRSEAAQAHLQREAARRTARRHAARLRREARHAARRRRARHRAAEARAAQQREAQARAEAEAAEAEEEAASSCDSNYSGACLDPAASDYDCEGGPGDGPYYTGEVTVVGSDPYGLDSDADGVGCEHE
jgi:hypothetical protein